MFNELQNIRSLIEDRRAALLAALRRKAPEEITEYLKITAAIKAMDIPAETGAGEYKKFRKPLDAVEALLNKAEKPLIVEDIAKSIEDGGWARGQVKNPYWNIIYAIRNHLNPRKPLKRPKVKRLKEVNGLIGKIEWQDEMFAAIQEEIK
jgi:hypothetical protein